VRVAQEGDRIVATLQKLLPGTAQAIRVVPVLSGNDAPSPLFIAETVTPPKRSLGEILSPARIAVALVALLGGLIAWRRFRLA
jgi:hypothetical protein